MIAKALAFVLLALQDEAAKGLEGCWKWDGVAKQFVRFEKSKVTLSYKDELTIMRASYAPGKVIVRWWGQKDEYAVSVKEGVLTLRRGAEEEEQYRKLDTVPDELSVRALVLGSTVPSDERVREIQDELAKRARRDQEVRSDLEKRTDRTRIEAMDKVDRDNTAWLVDFVGKTGWVDATRFGRNAAFHAFLLVQHSGHLALMMAALPKIEEDVKAGKASAQDYALLWDRLRLKLGEKQRYGTQIGTNKAGERVVLALEDRENVDKIRKEIGLPPLSKYLDSFKRGNNGKELKFEEE